MIRKSYPKVSIGFFLHIPFPSYEIFRILPWREEILDGLLGADQIGFHTFDYMRHFLSAAYRISGHEHNFGKLSIDGRLVNVDVFPMGIDYEKYAFPERIANKEDIDSMVNRLTSKGRKLILSIDRLDYTKGIPQRIQAFEKFVKDNPKYRGQSYPDAHRCSFSFECKSIFSPERRSRHTCREKLTESIGPLAGLRFNIIIGHFLLQI